MDIDVNTGPTHIFSTSDTRKIINMVRKYKRNNQIERIVIKNTDCLVSKFFDRNISNARFG